MRTVIKGLCIVKNIDSTESVAISIWLLGLGYFAFYIPYSVLIKALSSNMLMDYGVVSSVASLSPTAFLPIVLMGTVITMPLIIYSLGWYRYLGKNKFEPIDPQNRLMKSRNDIGLSRWTIYSGLSFAVIVATTTLAYSFVGVSIVFALLLMRGGVLIMSPLVDIGFNRTVHWYSWLALSITLLAVGFSLLQVDEYFLNGMVLLNLLGYLLGYMLRLRQMNLYAKDAQENLNRQFFVAENIVAMMALVVIAAATLMYHLLSHDVVFVEYVYLMVQSEVWWPALLIGVFYGVLGIFGSLIYLNRRENTFSIPVNRGASLLSGIVASLLIMYFFDGANLSVVQVASALVICFALFIMSFFDDRQAKLHQHSTENPMQRIWLFICDGNRMRSPMAAAICNKLLAKQLIEMGDKNGDIYADSAALVLGEKRDLPETARAALAEFNIRVDGHRAKQVSKRQIRQAEKIVCMNRFQCEALIDEFPWVASKVVNLGGETEISKPLGQEKHHFIDLANILYEHIQLLLGLDERNDVQMRLE